MRNAIVGFAVLAGLALWTLRAFGQEAQEIPLLKKAPVVDGTLGAGEWAQAIEVKEFTLFLPKEGDVPEGQRTVAWIGRTDKSRTTTQATEARPRSDQRSKPSVPGRMMMRTPTRPTRIAVIRRQPILSP